MPGGDGPMAAPVAIRDVTDTVALDDARAVADATVAILARSYGTALRAGVLHDAFDATSRLYDGTLPGFLACDLPYHDLRHAHDAALAAARLVDARVRIGGAGTLPAEAGTAAVLLALLHDAGFLRTSAESQRHGAQLARWHEARSVDFAQAYLRGTPLPHLADFAPMILATRAAERTATLFAGRDAVAVEIGCIVGTADLLCQVADPLYLERCYHHLYREIVLGAADDGAPPAFRDARDLVARTPAFCASVVVPRLAGDLHGAADALAARFAGRDPYAEAMRANVERCRRIVEGDRWDLLGPPPPTTTRIADGARG